LSLRFLVFYFNIALLLGVRCRSATDTAERFSGIGHTGQTYRAYYPVVSIPTRLLTALVAGLAMIPEVSILVLIPPSIT
jgi:hypothetical protein